MPMISRISGSSNEACKLLELTMIRCMLLTYPHLRGLHHPTTTMSLFPCEAFMASNPLICFLCKLF
ncbi:hypothetical protein Bca52824_063029 [Brassica carinata]|uniref:Uncharacterized protein n=1 Tax=Brassica carinata TaxID=52824 RepID=A0A8X7QDL1_BRACI|nr:hypothetical protein Bca52824_063029 [Brassica carinata]